MSVEGLAGGIGAGVAVAATPLLIFLLRKWSWLRYDRKDLPDAEQKAHNQRIQLYWLLPWFAMVALATWLLFCFFRTFAAALRPHFDGNVMMLEMSPLGWLLLSFFPSIVLGSLPVMALARWVHGAAEYRAMSEFSNTQQGVNQARFAAVALVVFLAADALLLPLAANYYVRLDDHALAFNRFWGFGEDVVALEKVVQVRRVTSFKAPIGNIVRKPYFEIVFDDHQPWSSKDWVLGDLRGVKLKTFVDHVLRMTGQTINTLDPFPTDGGSTAP